MSEVMKMWNAAVPMATSSAWEAFAGPPKYGEGIAEHLKKKFPEMQPELVWAYLDDEGKKEVRFDSLGLVDTQDFNKEERSNFDSMSSRFNNLLKDALKEII